MRVRPSRCRYSARRATRRCLPGAYRASSAGAARPGGMADFQNLDVLEELQARLTAELEPLVRCACPLRGAARRLPRCLRQR